MKVFCVILQAFFFVWLCFAGGCEPATPGVELPAETNKVSSQLSAYTSYGPVKIDILPLTEFVSDEVDQDGSVIKVYVGLLDEFGCQMKAPGVFRFELYKKVLRSSEQKGRRIAIWPDIDLTQTPENHKYWRDFLRSYEFALDFESQTSQSYILQVTCLCPNGKRLLAEFALKNGR